MPVSRKRSAVVRALKAEGSTNKEIETELGLSAASVRRYLRDSKELKSPKILLIDIETAPAHGRFWQPFKTTIQHFQVTKPWFIICWAAKWFGEVDVISDCVTPQEALMRSDARISKSIWGLVNEADVLIAHNLVRFDKRKLFARFIQNGLPKPRDSRVIDTLTQAQKHFAFLYHKLDYLNKIFSLRMKDETDYQLWVDCEGGNEDEPLTLHEHQEALNYMMKYNKSDILALEDLYVQLRPWMTSHPNLGLYVDDNDPMCPHCLSKDLEEDGEYRTDVSVFPAYRCNSCGALPRGRKSKVSVEKRKGLLISTAR